ncbi:FixH family protein [Lysobacter sp. A378]
MSTPDFQPNKPPRNKPATEEPTGGSRSPWRQPIVWLVIALPTVVVVASVVMIFIASGEGYSDQVIDTVSRTAQIQTADLGPDAIAQQEKLSAIVRIDTEQAFIEVLPVSGDFDRAAPLQLTLIHPTRAAVDQVLLLQPGELGWRLPTTIDASHDWKLQLEPQDARWRLKGRLPKGQLAANLHPSLQAP